MLTVKDTAYSIAKARAMEADRPKGERLFEDRYGAIFAAAGAHAEEGTNRFLALPHFVDGIRIRTRFIDDTVRAALDEGIRQIVLLGAGFDARGLRMPEIPARNAIVLEVDFEEQLAHKRALLLAAGHEIPAHVKHVACDFGAPDFDVALERDLVAAGFRIGAGAMFVWEGVIAYISQDTMDRSLRFMARVGGKGSRVVFDYSPLVFRPDVEPSGFSRLDDFPFATLWKKYWGTDAPPSTAAMSLGIAFV